MAITLTGMLTPADSDYPARLHALRRPPARLFVRPPATGERLSVLLASPIVAIVGARQATPAGCAFAERLAAQLAAAGVAVLSGLARGIDAAAHEGALARRGRTVAVIGCGVDRDYPAATAALAREVAREGAIVSEYAPGTPPAPFRFPERNRLVAALADLVVVVEAQARSGALITARLALEHGREVLAVPGAPWQSTAAGTLALLRDGATPCVDATDVLLALGIDPGEPRHDDPPLTPEAARLLGCVRRDAGPERVAVARCGLGGRSAARALHELEHARLIARRDDGWLVPIA